MREWSMNGCMGKKGSHAEEIETLVVDYQARAGIKHATIEMNLAGRCRDPRDFLPHSRSQP